MTTKYTGKCSPTVEDHLITRAREYVTDKYLDLADVSKFIERLVELHDANERLTARLRELESDKVFDVSDVSSTQDHDWQPTSTWFACSRCGKDAPSPYSGAPVARRPVRCG